MENKSISLYEIYERASEALSPKEKEKLIAKYCKRESLNRSDVSEKIIITEYWNNNKKQLRTACASLGINLKDFDFLSNDFSKVAYGKKQPRIPVVLAPLLVAILKTNRKQGSYISKIIKNDFDHIELKQKKDFIDIYHKELIAAKSYSDITDEIIVEIIKELSMRAEQAERLNDLIKTLEDKVLLSIKRDIYNINKVDSFNGIPIPNINWIKYFIDEHTKSDLYAESLSYSSCPHCSFECTYSLCRERKSALDEKNCKKCSYRKNCDVCLNYGDCKSLNRTNRLFSSIGYIEREFFTDIYIGFLEMAKYKFFEFLAEYNEVLSELLNEVSEIELGQINSVPNDYIEQDKILIKEFLYNENMVKTAIAKVIYESGFSQHIYREILSVLSTKGIIDSSPHVTNESLNAAGNILRENGYLDTE